jgi:hypothetical protein
LLYGKRKMSFTLSSRINVLKLRTFDSGAPIGARQQGRKKYISGFLLYGKRKMSFTLSSRINVLKLRTFDSGAPIGARRQGRKCLLIDNFAK